jgi:hypothetical protein
MNFEGVCWNKFGHRNIHQSWMRILYWNRSTTVEYNHCVTISMNDIKLMRVNTESKHDDEARLELAYNLNNLVVY